MNRVTDKTLRRTVPSSVSFRSPSLDKLRPLYRKSLVDTLHLGTRAHNFLRRAGIRNIGQLIDSARCGIERCWAAGRTTTSEIEDSLCALSSSVTRSGEVDWVVYAIERNFLVLPERSSRRLSSRQFLKILPGVVDKAIASKYGKIESVILRRYLFEADHRSRSLQRLAEQLKCTKQGLSLAQGRVLLMLRGAIFDDIYRDCPFRFRQSFVEPFRQLRAVLQRSRNRPLLYSEWQNILSGVFGFTPKQFSPVENFFVSVLGYRVFRPGGGRYQPFLLPIGTSSTTFSKTLNRTDKLLSFYYPNGLSQRELLKKLRASTAPDLTGRDIPALLNSVPGIERDKGEEKVKMRISDVSLQSDQMERLLRDKGSPMHLREFLVELQRVKRSPTRVHTINQIGTALTADKRFKSIGRTGYWILAEWKKIETRTVPQMSEDILRKVKRPMTEVELFDLISARRSVAPASIGRMLLESGKFRRIAPRTWVLK